jgi:RNA 2',3'-cyclic 3'-phosphodiesterase
MFGWSVALHQPSGRPSMASESGPDEIDGLAASSGGPQPARVFVALKIAAAIADELAKVARELERVPVRLVAPADIHLTLVPPWNEVSIPEAAEKLRRVADRCDDFTLELRHVGYGPEPRRPRLLWAECVAEPNIEQLRAALLLTFGQTDERPFRPHVTLARLRGNGAVIARKYPIDRDLVLTQRVGSVELMQSPPPGGSGYKVLASIEFGANRESPLGTKG